MILTQMATITTTTGSTTGVGQLITIKDAECKTDPEFGKPPSERTIEEHIKSGVINLDKPAGPTSHEVVAWVKRILSVERAGHSGTLDPQVTGVLPTALLKATRVLNYLLPAGKEYVGIMHLHREVSKQELEERIEKFRGKILQKPPVKSAVKRMLRARTVYSLDILEMDGRDVLFLTNVQAGTYIRKLCHDIGTGIGGANMKELRRTRAGPFLVKDSHTLQELADAKAVFDEEGGREEPLRRVIIPVEDAVTHLKRVIIKDGAVEAICNGAPLAVAGVQAFNDGITVGEKLAMFSMKGELVAVGEGIMGADELLEKTHGLAVKTERVLLDSGTYPRMWKSSNMNAKTG